MIRNIVEIDITKILKNNRLVHGVRRIKLFDDYIQIKGVKIKYYEIFVARCHRGGLISFEYIKNTGYTHRYVIKGDHMATHEILNKINEINQAHLIHDVLEEI